MRLKLKEILQSGDGEIGPKYGDLAGLNVCVVNNNPHIISKL